MQHFRRLDQAIAAGILTEQAGGRHRAVREGDGAAVRAAARRDRQLLVTPSFAAVRAGLLRAGRTGRQSGVPPRAVASFAAAAEVVGADRWSRSDCPPGRRSSGRELIDYHHATTDTSLDPHSPLHQGFLLRARRLVLAVDGTPVLCVAYALGGPARMLVDAWMRPRTNQEHNGLAEDVSADRWYRFISRPGPYAMAMHLHAAIPTRARVSMVGRRLACCGTLAHAGRRSTTGRRDRQRRARVWPQAGTAARRIAEQRVDGYLVLGEGWHANHHRFPHSARHGSVARTIRLDLAESSGCFARWVWRPRCASTKARPCRRRT